MMERNDEELQRMFENGKFSDKTSLDEEAKAYSELFEALNREPEIGLPYDFAAKVARSIKVRQKRTSELKYNLAAVAIFLGLIIVACSIMVAYAAVNTSTLLKYKWLLILVPVGFIAIQYLDQKLVKTKIFNNQNQSYKP